MRIAYICCDPGIPVFGTKGASVHIQEVVRELRFIGHEVALYAVRSGKHIPDDLTDLELHLEAVADVLGEFDLLLLMTVEPGFGGQPFIESMLSKIRRARELVGARGLNLRVQVDGGITSQTIERAAQAGADVFVAGSAVYRAEDALAAIHELREAASSHRHDRSHDH